MYTLINIINREYGDDDKPIGKLIKHIIDIFDERIKNKYLLITIIAIIKYCSEETLRFIHKDQVKTMFSFFNKNINHHYAQRLIFYCSKQNRKLLFGVPNNSVKITKSRIIIYFMEKLGEPYEANDISYIQYLPPYWYYNTPYPYYYRYTSSDYYEYDIKIYPSSIALPFIINKITKNDIVSRMYETSAPIIHKTYKKKTNNFTKHQRYNNNKIPKNKCDKRRFITSPHYKRKH
jgi:hypothetical protein